MSGVYDLLGFASTDPIANATVSELSDSVKNQMALMPPLVNAWQKSDIANQTTTGYFQNPCLNSTSSAWTAANNIVLVGVPVGTTQTITDTLNVVYQTANTFCNANVGSNFIDHTNRMSNVVPMDSRVNLPHFNTSIGYGKLMMYLVNQTDNIQNNSPMIGSFTSVLASNTINANASTFISLANYYLSTVYAVSTPDGNGGYVNVNHSSIDLANATALSSAFTTLSTEMQTLRQNDINFFTNTVAVAAAYSTVAQFSNLGQTDTNLIVNHIGTPKLVTRLTTGNTA